MVKKNINPWIQRCYFFMTKASCHNHYPCKSSEGAAACNTVSTLPTSDLCNIEKSGGTWDCQAENQKTAKLSTYPDHSSSKGALAALVSTSGRDQVRGFCIEAMGNCARSPKCYINSVSSSSSWLCGFLRNPVPSKFVN